MTIDVTCRSYLYSPPNYWKTVSDRAEEAERTHRTPYQSLAGNLNAISERKRQQDILQGLCTTLASAMNLEHERACQLARMEFQLDKIERALGTGNYMPSDPSFQPGKLDVKA